MKTNKVQDIEEWRTETMNAAIDLIYSESHSDQISSFNPPEFSRGTTVMFEIVAVHAAFVDVKDYDCDEECSPVLFPDSVHFLLRPNDVFMAIIEWDVDHWNLLSLSPAYESVLNEQ